MENGEEYLQGLHSKIAAATAEMSKYRKIATEAEEELKVAEADLALQFELQKSVRKKKNTRTTEMAALHKQRAR